MTIFKNFNDGTDTSYSIKSTFSEVPFPVMVFEGVEQALSFANQALLDILGKDESVLGKPLSQLVSKVEFQSLTGILGEVLVTGNVHSGKEFEARILKNGKEEVILFDYSCSPLRGEANVITGVLVVAHDVTERLVIKKRLDENEKCLARLLAENSAKSMKTSDSYEIKNYHEKQSILSSIIDSSDDTILSKTLEGIITSWNPAAQKMFGYTEEEVIGKHISILIPNRLLDEEKIIIGNIIQGNKIDHFETVRVRKDGSEINISLTVSPIRDMLGNIIGASKIARDISDVRGYQEKQAILAAIVDSSDDAIISKTLQGIITSWNPGAERMFGYSEVEIIGKHISVLIPSKLQHEENIIIGNIAKGNKVDHFETVRITKDGRELQISLSVSPIKDNSGNIIGASKIARDITEQKSVELRLKNYADTLETINLLCRTISEELDIKRLLQKVTDSATQVLSAHFGAFFYNPVNTQHQETSLYTLSGASMADFDKIEVSMDSEIFQSTFRGKEIIRLNDITEDDRYTKRVSSVEQLPMKSYLAVPVISKKGDVIGGLVLGHPEAGKFTQDHENIVIAMASQASIALENAKLFEEIRVLNTKKDEFIGMASHELKTPLTSMAGYLQILERSQTEEKQKAFVKKTLYQVSKLAALVSDILDVSKIEAGKLQFSYSTFNFSELVLDCVDLIQHSSKKHKISISSPNHEVFVPGDKHRIEQLIINLLTNAIKYSPKADRIDILVKDLDDTVQLGVKDYGIGIVSDKLNDVFSRFYRVEGLSPGMSGLGIGLYISKEIAARHNGNIWVESEIGKGSTFWFTLPKKTIFD